MPEMPTVTIDQKFGHWRVVCVTFRRALCRCRCGQVHEVSVDALTSGESTSCGCSTPTPAKVRAIREAKQEQKRQRDRDWRIVGRGR